MMRSLPVEPPRPNHNTCPKPCQTPFKPLCFQHRTTIPTQFTNKAWRWPCWNSYWCWLLFWLFCVSSQWFTKSLASAFVCCSRTRVRIRVRVRIHTNTLNQFLLGETQAEDERNCVWAEDAKSTSKCNLQCNPTNWTTQPPLLPVMFPLRVRFVQVAQKKLGEIARPSITDVHDITKFSSKPCSTSSKPTPLTCRG